MNGSKKNGSVTQTPAVRAPKRAAIDKVSVLIPRPLRKRVLRTAKDDRRALSPQIVTLIEAGLAAREGNGK